MGNKGENRYRLQDDVVRVRVRHKDSLMCSAYFRVDSLHARLNFHREREKETRVNRTYRVHSMSTDISDDANKHIIN